MTITPHLSWGVALLVFGGGLLSFFSPCVVPLLPGYIGYLAGIHRPPVLAASGVSGRVSRAGAASADGGRATALVLPDGSASKGVPVGLVGLTRLRSTRPLLPATLLFVAGFSVAFVLLGLLVASFGVLFAAYKLVMETVVGIVLLVMGAFLLGLLPRGWSNVLMREVRIHLPRRTLGGLGAAGPFVLGMVFAAGWTPCIGPVLAALLTYVGATANLSQGALLLGLYAVGFALPFIAIGLGWSAGLRTLGWARHHAHALSLASGVGLVLVGLFYVSGQVQTFAIWAQRYTPTFWHG